MFFSLAGAAGEELRGKQVWVLRGPRRCKGRVSAGCHWMKIREGCRSGDAWARRPAWNAWKTGGEPACPEIITEIDSKYGLWQFCRSLFIIQKNPERIYGVQFLRILQSSHIWIDFYALIANNSMQFSHIPVFSAYCIELTASDSHI